MEIRGPNSDSFELRVIGYLSGHAGENEHEANRLRVYTRATFEGHAWTTIHPILLTWEIAALADWLEALSTDAPPKPELKFQEPNIWLEVQRWSTERVQFRVYFEREHRPVWLLTNGAPGEVWADLDCSVGELKEWAEDLRQQIEKFPPRGNAAPRTAPR